MMNDEIIKALQGMIDAFEYEGQTEGENNACHKAKQVIQQVKKNDCIADVSNTLTAGDVERINKTPIWNFLDWLADNNKIEKKSLLWDHMNTYIKGVVKRFKEAEKVNGR